MSSPSAVTIATVLHRWENGVGIWTVSGLGPPARHTDRGEAWREACTRNVIALEQAVGARGSAEVVREQIQGLVATHVATERVLHQRIQELEETVEAERTRWRPIASRSEQLEARVKELEAEIEQLRAQRTAEQERADVVEWLKDHASKCAETDDPRHWFASMVLEVDADEIKSGAHVGAAKGE